VESQRVFASCGYPHLSSGGFGGDALRIFRTLRASDRMEKAGWPWESKDTFENRSFPRASISSADRGPIRTFVRESAEAAFFPLCDTFATRFLTGDASARKKSLRCFSITHSHPPLHPHSDPLRLQSLRGDTARILGRYAATGARL